MMNPRNPNPPMAGAASFVSERNCATSLSVARASFSSLSIHDGLGRPENTSAVMRNMVLPPFVRESLIGKKPKDGERLFIWPVMPALRCLAMENLRKRLLSECIPGGH